MLENLLQMHPLLCLRQLLEIVDKAGRLATGLKIGGNHLYNGGIRGRRCLPFSEALLPDEFGRARQA
jgi:hypothetical protein